MTVIDHEIGHLLDLDHLGADGDDLMAELLAPGLRRLATADNVDRLLLARLIY